MATLGARAAWTGMSTTQRCTHGLGAWLAYAPAALLVSHSAHSGSCAHQRLAAHLPTWFRHRSILRGRITMRHRQVEQTHGSAAVTLVPGPRGRAGPVGLWARVAGVSGGGCPPSGVDLAAAIADQQPVSSGESPSPGPSSISRSRGFQLPCPRICHAGPACNQAGWPLALPRARRP